MHLTETLTCMLMGLHVSCAVCQGASGELPGLLQVWSVAEQQAHGRHQYQAVPKQVYAVPHTSPAQYWSWNFRLSDSQKQNAHASHCCSYDINVTPDKRKILMHGEQAVAGCLLCGAAISLCSQCLLASLHFLWHAAICNLEHTAFCFLEAMFLIDNMCTTGPYKSVGASSSRI